jgi:hypothetical protein
MVRNEKPRMKHGPHTDEREEVNRRDAEAQRRTLRVEKQLADTALISVL